VPSIFKKTAPGGDVKIEKERETAIRILAEFEKLLADKGIKIPSNDREPGLAESGVCLYGSEYYMMEDAITDKLKSSFKDNDNGFFPITSVHRLDIKGAMNLTDKQVSKITDDMVREIARKMADDYCEQLFWDHLPIIVEIVAEREGLKLDSNK